LINLPERSGNGYWDPRSAKATNMKAIDVHGHFGTWDTGSGGLVTELKSGGIDLVRRRAEAADICLTVVSAMEAFTPHGGNVPAANESAREAAEKYSDIRFWAVLDPRLPGIYKQVGSLLVHPRCKGIKIHPDPLCHPYEIRDRGDEIFEFAAGYGAIISAHSGCPGSFPEDFVPFANKYPSVSVILAHLGYSADGSFSRQVSAIRRAEAGNVYTDTSSANSINSGLIEWAVTQVGMQHILFGTDSPLYFAACQKARIESAEIEQEAKQAILFENAARLLGEQETG